MITPHRTSHQEPAVRIAIAFLGMLVASSIGLAAGIAIALLGAASLWLP